MLVLFNMALGSRLTAYVSSDLAFFEKVRSDFRDNTCTNTPILILIHKHILDVQHKYKPLREGDIPFIETW
jgi:hypothetical protein